MSNVSRIRGLRPVRHLNGSPWNGQVETFAFLSGDATAAYTGDTVKLSGTASATGIASITSTTADADLPVGVLVGNIPDYSNLNQPAGYRAASTARTAFVVVDPTVVYEIQADSATAITDIGLNVGLNYTAGSTTTGLSGYTAKMSTKATTSTLPLKIIGVLQRPDQDMADSSNWKLLVTLNTNVFGSAGTAGV
ncbi:MAG TPA: hypothetical protein VFM18_00280 [Methanosarcina sp.]|nr:hypothetical protein [Methanosarcina sp.]